MGGIAGIYNYRSGRPAAPSALRAMGACLAHRGPDDEGYWEEGPLGLAHKRLTILDTSRRGRQPMFTEDGQLAIVFNGEIYNFLELRAELEAHGHTFRTRTDTEVLLHLYQEEGEAMLSRLNGMFAFAIWDRRRSACSSPATGWASSRSTTRRGRTASPSPPRSRPCSWSRPSPPRSTWRCSTPT